MARERVRVVWAGILCACVAHAAAAVTFGSAAPFNTNAATDSAADWLPRIVADGKGTWIAVWNVEEPTNDLVYEPDLYYSRSTDNGQTWSSPRFLNTNAPTDSGFDYVPELATDGAGNWVAVWESNELAGGLAGSPFDIFYARSNDNGATWSAPAPLNTNALTDSPSNIRAIVVTDGRGVWITAWEAGYAGGEYDALMARSTDAGATWSDPVALNADAATDTANDNNPQLAADRNGNWVAVWNSWGGTRTNPGNDYDILVSRSADGGITWSTPVTLNTDALVDTGSEYYAQVKSDTKGNWVAVWEQFGGTTGSDFDLMAARSVDNGASWTAPAPVNSNAALDSGTDEFPQLTTDRAGHWLVTWQSTDTLGGTIGTDLDILFAVSEDNGATWTNSAALNSFAAADPEAQAGDSSPCTATDGFGNWIAVWSSSHDLDGIGTDADILFARTVIPAQDDEFDSLTLDPKWHWVREDLRLWSLATSPGSLRIVTTATDLLEGFNNAPVLLQAAPTGNFDIVTKVTMTPIASFQQGGLILYGDDDNYVRLTYGYFFSSRGFEFAQEARGTFSSVFQFEPNGNTFYLRIAKYDQDFAGFYSVDGVSWIRVGRFSALPITVREMGLLAFNGTVVGIPGIPADFDFFHARAVVTGSLRGKITDANTRAPLSCASVHVASDDGSVERTAVTDLNGAYSMPNLPAGTYVVEAFSPGYAPLVSNSTIIEGAATVLNLGLGPATTLGGITGVVTDDLFRPLGNIRVDVFVGETRLATTYTCAEGRYEIRGLFGKQTTADVEYSSPNYETTTHTVEVTPDAVAEQDAVMTPKAGILPGSMAGTVLHFPTSDPIAGARISLSGPANLTVDSDDYGAYGIAALPEGTYTVQASAVGYGGQTQVRLVGSAQTEVVNFSLAPQSPVGDINSDGGVNAVDVQLVINAALGQPTGYDCDISGDGTVNAVDVQSVINAALGIY